MSDEVVRVFRPAEGAPPLVIVAFGDPDGGTRVGFQLAGQLHLGATVEDPIRPDVLVVLDCCRSGDADTGTPPVWGVWETLDEPC